MNVSVDEQMIGTNARLSFIQYLPKKPKKWGVKVWVLADSANGYVPAFEIYTCAADGVEHGLAYVVVMHLMEDYVTLTVAVVYMLTIFIPLHSCLKTFSLEKQWHVVLYGQIGMVFPSKNLV